MTNQKVSRPPMEPILERLDAEIAWYSEPAPFDGREIRRTVVKRDYLAMLRAARAAIEEREWLREQVGEWKKRAGIIYEDRDWDQDEDCVALLKELRDFKLDGEEEK